MITGARRICVTTWTGLKEAGIPEWPFGFEGREADQVGGAQLRELVSDKTWTGRHKNGTEFIQYFDKAGNTAYRSANTNVTGVIEVRDDRLCEKFDGYFLDRMACGYVYRNTTNDERDAEYIHVTPQALEVLLACPLITQSRCGLRNGSIGGRLPTLLQLFRHRVVCLTSGQYFCELTTLEGFFSKPSAAPGS